MSSLNFNKISWVVPYTLALLIGFLVVGQRSALNNCMKHTIGNRKSSTLQFMFVNLDNCVILWVLYLFISHPRGYKCSHGTLEDSFHFLWSVCCPCFQNLVCNLICCHCLILIIICSEYIVLKYIEHVLNTKCGQISDVSTLTSVVLNDI